MSLLRRPSERLMRWTRHDRSALCTAYCSETNHRTGWIMPAVRGCLAAYHYGTKNAKFWHTSQYSFSSVILKMKWYIVGSWNRNRLHNGSKKHSDLAKSLQYIRTILHILKCQKFLWIMRNDPHRDPDHHQNLNQFSSPTRPKKFIDICQLFELSYRQTDRQTGMQSQKHNPFDIGYNASQMSCQ